MCSLCGDQAPFIPCTVRLILEKKTIAKKIACKHYAIHSSLLDRKGRNKDAEYNERMFHSPEGALGTWGKLFLSIDW